MVDLNAHEAGNGGQSQGKPTTRGVLLYSEREGPPLTVTWLEFRSVEGLHPPGIFNSNEKRILPFAAIRKRHHSGDWPVYGHLPAAPNSATASSSPPPVGIRQTPGSRPFV